MAWLWSALWLQTAADCNLKRIDGSDFTGRLEALTGPRPFVMHSMRLAKPSISREEMLLRGRVQLESGIDEAKAFFKLTKDGM